MPSRSEGPAQGGPRIDLSAYERVVVTGGLGFVGRHLLSALAPLGLPILALDTVAPIGPPAAGTVHRRADIRDPAPIGALLRPGDLVFHLAGNASGTVSVQKPRFDFETNAIGTLTVCEAVRACARARLVYVSTAMVYGVPQTCPIPESHPVRPFIPYAASKLSGEHLVSAFVQSYGLSASIGRAFTLYGPGEDPQRAGGEVSQFLRWHLNGLPVPATGDIDRKTRDFCHVDDLVQALLVLAQYGADGEVYNLGSGTETSLRQLAATIGTATGRECELQTDTSVTEDTYRMVADVSKLRALGYRPRRQLAEGVAELVDLLGPDPELPSMATIFRAAPAPVPSPEPVATGAGDLR